jgi:hypothetical protein
MPSRPVVLFVLRILKNLDFQPRMGLVSDGKWDNRAMEGLLRDRQRERSG